MSADIFGCHNQRRGQRPGNIPLRTALQQRTVSPKGQEDGASAEQRCCEPAPGLIHKNHPSRSPWASPGSVPASGWAWMSPDTREAHGQGAEPRGWGGSASPSGGLEQSCLPTRNAHSGLGVRNFQHVEAITLFWACLLQLWYCLSSVTDTFAVSPRHSPTL